MFSAKLQMSDCCLFSSLSPQPLTKSLRKLENNTLVHITRETIQLHEQEGNGRRQKWIKFLLFAGIEVLKVPDVAVRLLVFQIYWSQTYFPF